jgi:hypothetical protein
VFAQSVGTYLPELFTNPQYAIGWCPTCGRHDGRFNVVDRHFGVCHAHEKMWYLGKDIYGRWVKEDEGDWRRNVVQTFDYDSIDFNEALDWTVLASAFVQAGLALPQPKELFLSWEDQWLLGQTGRWEPPYAMWGPNDSRQVIVLTREECRDRDDAPSLRLEQQWLLAQTGRWVPPTRVERVLNEDGRSDLKQSEPLTRDECREHVRKDVYTSNPEGAAFVDRVLGRYGVLVRTT